MFSASYHRYSDASDEGIWEDAETRRRGDAEKEIENTINVADRNQLISFNRV